MATRTKIDVTTKFSQADNLHKEFYYYLGLLATKFAILESNLTSLLGRLIIDDIIISYTMLEKNNLSQNMELLKKINRYRKFEEKTVTKLLERISGIKVYRNLFIHGVWEKPFIEEGDIMMICSEEKIVYEELERSRKWTSPKSHKFRLAYLRKQVLNMDEILLTQKFLLDKVENFEEQEFKASYFEAINKCQKPIKL